MTTLREAAQQALEALEEYQAKGAPFMSCDAAANALRAALAEPQVWVCPDSAEHRYAKPGHCEDCGKTLVQVAEPVQEPVAWLFTNLQSGDYDFCYQEDEHDHDREMWHKQPLYSAPPQRKPLTEEEIDKVSRRWVPVAAYMGLHEHAEMTQEQAQQSMRKFARAIERAHGIKENT